MAGSTHSLSMSKQDSVAAVETLADLAAVLRQLRRREARARQGRELTYQQIAVKTGWSIGIIGGYLTGVAMPPTDRLDVLIRLFGGGPAEQSALGTARDRLADAKLATGPAGPSGSPRPAARSVPRQLPAPPTVFVGRPEHLGALDRSMTGDPAAAIPIAAVTGMAGVGKTALALHWAHRMADRFPDGQLFVNLRGYHPGEPMDPADALAGFLHSLGVDQAEGRLDLNERAALYRTLLAGRNLLIVLDNARSAAQIRPLLPGSPTCMVVVTSRDSLAGLVVTEGARRVDLDVLTAVEAARLLRALLGDRVDAAPGAAASLSQYCGRLPLALRVAAEQAAYRSHAPLQQLVNGLRDERTRLDTLDTGEDSTTVRSVLSWSYRTLSAGAARLFRLIACSPGPDLAAPAMASLGGIALPEARRLLTELTRAHMLIEARPGRYGCHDLLRAYAAELCFVEDDQADREAATRRLLDYSLHTAA